MPDDSTPEMILACEGELKQLHHECALMLDALRQQVVSVATRHADLGDMTDIYRHAASIATTDDLWQRLKALTPDMREDVLRFAMRAATARRKGQLEDAAQLQFALAAAPAEGGTGAGAPPQRHADNEVMVLTNSVQRLRGFLAEWQQRQPVKAWDATIRASVKATIKPLVEIYESL